ncbi:glycosyltransferase [bacterium]|nr:glycosyltransferase [bacterium]
MSIKSENKSTMRIGDEKLKVLHITEWYPSRSGPVIGIFIKEHIISTLPFSVPVVLNAIQRKGLPRFYQIEESFEDNIRVFRIYHKVNPVVSKTTFFIWIVFHLYKKLLSQGFKPDLIHAHIYTAGIPAVILAKFHNIPVIFSKHWSAFPLGRVRGLKKFKAKFVFERADMVCPVSENLRKHIERLGIKAKFYVVPNAVDASLFHPPTHYDTGKEEAKRKLLFVGSLIPIKGLPYLLKALNILRDNCSDFFLDIVGDGPNRGEYEMFARDMGLEDFVHFHGIKSKSEIAELMWQADILVLPSEWENLPCVLIEAMASGLPVVATRVGGVAEIINEKTGILVPAKNTERLSEAINYALEHLADFKREEIAEIARERFSYQAVGKTLRNIYKKVIEER